MRLKIVFEIQIPKFFGNGMEMFITDKNHYAEEIPLFVVNFIDDTATIFVPSHP